MLTAWASEGLSLIGILNINIIVVVIIIIAKLLLIPNREGVLTNNNVLCIILTGDSNSIIARVDGSHVVKKRRLLNKALVAISTLVAKLIPVAHYMVIHGVLATACLRASLVRADKQPSLILRVLNGHLKTTFDKINKMNCDFNF